MQTIATGVSAHAELFELAAGESADLLIVHHGLFWGSGVTAIDAALKRRLQILFDADIALAAYHLPLDAHPELGNNALLASALGAGDLTPFALHHGQPIGFIASLPGDGGSDGVPAQELFARVASDHRAPAARVRSRTTARAPSGDRLRRRRRLHRRCRQRRAPTPSSPESPPSARWRRRASRACT